MANMKHEEMNSFLCFGILLFRNQILALYFKLIALCLKDAVPCNKKHIYLGQIPLSDT